MSGGHFSYHNDDLCHELYGWTVFPDYGDRGFNKSKLARQINPLEDLVISELVFDVFCLLHSYDWYASADTCKETYQADVKRFKDKWLKQLPETYVREIIDDEINAVRDKLYQAFNIDGGDTSSCTT